MAQFRELTNSYRLEKILASGRSATVLRAVELATGHAAALKLINVFDPAGLTEGSARLGHLAETLRGLGHVGFPAVLDWGFTTEGSAFLAMELLPGTRFDSLAGAPPDRMLPLVISAVEAVAALSDAGLAHLNLSSENLWVVPAAGAGRDEIKLLGLGTPIFRPPAGDPGAQGEAGFRAPEALAGGGDSRSDVYSLARILCQVLGAAVDLTGHARPSVQLPPALSFDLANAEVLRNVLERSLASAPEARPRLAEMRSALRLALGFTEPAFQEPAATPADPADPAEPPPVVLPGLAALDMTALDLSLPDFPDDRPPQWGATPPTPAAPQALQTPQVTESPAPPTSLRFDGEPTPVFEPFDEPLPDLGFGGAEADLPPLPPAPPPLPQPPLAAAPPPFVSSLAAPAPVAPPPLERSAIFPPPPVGGGTTATPPAARPPALAPPPPALAEPEGDVLRSIDDELARVLAPLPAAAPAASAPARGQVSAPRGPSAAPAPAMPGMAPPPRPAAAPSRRILGLPKMVFLGAIGALILLAFAAVVVFLLGRGAVPEGGSDAVQAPAPSAPPPLQPPTEKLQAVLSAVGLGEDYKAWRALASITPEELRLLSAQDQQSLSAAEATLVQNASERLAADLPRGLESGNLEELRGLAAAAARVSPTLPPEAQEARGKIDSALALYGRGQEALAANHTEEALDHFAAAFAAVPKLSDPESLRDRAAEVLVAKAEPLARQGLYDQAIAQLEPLRRSWPERPGLADLVKRYETSQQLGQEQEALLATLPSFERRRKPHEGLRALGDAKPVPHLEQRFAEARARLEGQLRQLDGKPPQVVLRDGFGLTYARGTVANLSFRVTDDYEVVSVRMFAAPEGGKMRNVPLEKARGGQWYTTQIRPDFHRNGTVRFYVTATDLSGQEGTLGSASQPLELRREGAGFR